MQRAAHPPSAFDAIETHGVLQRFGAEVNISSEGLGWTSAYASKQRERPFEGHFHALSDCLVVLHRGGPVDVVFRQGGQAQVRHVPKGGIFFLPAGQECDVELRAQLDTTHIYLRSHLFQEDSNSADRIYGLAPLFGDRDPVIEHLAEAMGQMVEESLPSAALTVDPIARALARRFIDINFRKTASSSSRRIYLLNSKQIVRIRDLVETNLGTQITLETMAKTCGISTEHFVRMFKASVGMSPHQYVISRRVERAKTLLHDEQHSLADIAILCGFSHQEHLNRMFRRLTGSTPGHYRRIVS